MILRAINDIGKRGGSSAVAIANYLKTNYPVPGNVSRYLRVALRKAIDSGSIIKASLRTYRIKPHHGAEPTSRKRKRSRSTSAKRTTSPKKASPKKASPRKKATSKVVALKKKTKKARTASSSSPSTSSSPASSGEPLVSPSKAPVVSKPIGLKGDYLWQYDHNGWKNYEATASNVVEDVYQNYLSNRGDTDVRAVKSGQWEYLVDFMALKQTNIQHEAHTTRNIRRIKV